MKASRGFVICSLFTITLALMALVPQAALADPLPCQQPAFWLFNGNGYTGFLRVAVDPSGNVTGRLDGGSFDNNILGFWNDRANKLTFIRIQALAERIDQVQIYTAHLFPSGDPNFPNALAGSFEAFQGTGATADQSVFGWSAIGCGQ